MTGRLSQGAAGGLPREVLSPWLVRDSHSGQSLGQDKSQVLLIRENLCGGVRGCGCAGEREGRGETWGNRDPGPQAGSLRRNRGMASVQTINKNVLN